MAKKVRHILGLSGGKDSTALAILLHKAIPQLEYFFCDTGKELPETYEYLDRIQARLGIHIEYLKPELHHTKDGGEYHVFDLWMDLNRGYLPSPNNRWCTINMKIKPLEKFIGDDEVYSYIGIRADENRDGYLSTKANIHPVYPYKPKDFKIINSHRPNLAYDQQQLIKHFQEQGIGMPIRKNGYALEDVKQVLDESGIGLPDYYRWRTRSGCYFCFFQRKYEWVRLAEEHPDLFQKSIEYEQQHSDGRKFTWNQGESLEELLARKDQILAEHEKAMAREKKQMPNRSLAEILEDVLEDEEDQTGCLVCHL
ncbi:MAG: phosphoadenosine phosphosulfate reductase family protein [SAR324 cluster bacterium]|nr:phosphoadenosine phosphosulfate reductase family protein [SAR324 cluster bacterium]